MLWLGWSYSYPCLSLMQEARFLDRLQPTMTRSVALVWHIHLLLVSHRQFHQMESWLFVSLPTTLRVSVALCARRSQDSLQPPVPTLTVNIWTQSDFWQLTKASQQPSLSFSSQWAALPIQHMPMRLTFSKLNLSSRVEVTTSLLSPLMLSSLTPHPLVLYLVNQWS